MNSRPLGTLLLLPLVLPALTAAAFGASPVWTEDFESTSLVKKGSDPYIGGNWGGSQLGFGVWASTTETSYADIIDDGGGTGNKVLRTWYDSTNNWRGGAIVLSPNIFTGGAGDYELTYEIPAYAAGGAGSYAEVSVWSGKDYDLTGNTSAALIVGVTGSNHNNTLAVLGNASSTSLESAKPTGTGTFTMSFHYDGVSAIGLFFGSYEASSWSAPTVQYDNISVTPVPESSSMLAAGLLVGLGCFWRRRATRCRW
jgi:hypothetical protein